MGAMLFVGITQAHRGHGPLLQARDARPWRRVRLPAGNGAGGRSYGRYGPGCGIGPP